MNEYISMAHMSVIKGTDFSSNCHLPYHGVLKDDFLIICLLVVFDGTSDFFGVAVNDFQMV